MGPFIAYVDFSCRHWRVPKDVDSCRHNLGIRAGEAAGPRLDDIAWRKSSLQVIGKCDPALVLPMLVNFCEPLGHTDPTSALTYARVDMARYAKWHPHG